MVEETGLPASLEDIELVFGTGVAVKLMQHYGGRDVLFPKSLKAGHEWFKIFGEETAYKLCHHLSGQRMYVPSGRRVSRRIEIKKLEEAGKKRHEICRMLDLSERHIRRLSNADPPPIPLFPDET
nr:helix-turn-helix domain-containing protein [uncultured Celeribacter sp.]